MLLFQWVIIPILGASLEEPLLLVHVFCWTVIPARNILTSLPNFSKRFSIQAIQAIIFLLHEPNSPKSFYFSNSDVES